MPQPSEAQPSRLIWESDLDDAVLEPIIGSGAPFEFRTETVAGYEREVFIRQPRNLRRYFEAAVASDPHLDLLVEGENTWTRGEALAEIDRISVELADRYGVGAGDRVGIVSDNTAAYALTFWAVTSLGAIISSFNGWWSALEMLHGIELSETMLILGDEPRLRRLAEVDAEVSQPVVDLEDLRNAASTRDATGFRASDPEPDDPAVILFTSGTTGRPKGATLSHRNILHFVWATLCGGAINAAVNPPPESAGAQRGTILASPLFHVSGLVGLIMSGPSFGWKQVIPSPGRWDETEHLELTAKHDVISWSGVPTQFQRLLRHPEFERYDLSSLATVGGGGAPFSPELAREIQQKLPNVALSTGYGMSESVGLGTRVLGDAMAATSGAVGGANITVRIEIRDPMGRVVPEGTVGEICVNTASLFLGYWRNEKATAEAFDEAGWYRTGDFGRVQDGQLVLESRMRDLIIRGGENIYPLEVENCLMDNPDVDDAAVIGVDHEILGQEVEAFIVPRPGSTLSDEDVREWVARRLAKFKVPAGVTFVDALPYTDTGKVLKQELERQVAGRSS